MHTVFNIDQKIIQRYYIFVIAEKYIEFFIIKQLILFNIFTGIIQKFLLTNNKQ